ncbi:MAG: hypothetical protein EBU08_20070 [Micrococcales bacterium]|nr:hypothetical protein [Micrococcales bacterium]
MANSVNVTQVNWKYNKTATYDSLSVPTFNVSSATVGILVANVRQVVPQTVTGVSSIKAIIQFNDGVPGSEIYIKETVAQWTSAANA